MANYKTDSLDDLAKANGIKSYDTAMPQDWMIAAQATIDNVGRLYGHIVWCYDDIVNSDGTTMRNIMGYPLAMTAHGHWVLARMAFAAVDMKARLATVEADRIKRMERNASAYNQRDGVDCPRRECQHCGHVTYQHGSYCDECGKLIGRK